jgi:hypothetical protein
MWGAIAGEVVRRSPLNLQFVRQYRLYRHIKTSDGSAVWDV